MNKADEALADVRGWLCDNLNEGNAGKVCGMLSVVSRHITELEDENARLRSCLSDDAENARQIMAENAKLREYVTAVANDVYGSELFDCLGCRFFDRCYNDAEKEHDGRGCQWLLWARELRIEVD